MTLTDPILQARALLEREGVSPEDGAAFLGNLTVALTSPDAPKFKVAADQRQVWARVFLAVAGFLLGPPAPETPPPEEADEEEEFQLTQSEFEIWKSTKEKAPDAAGDAVEEPPAPEEDAPPAPESEEEEEGEAAPARSATDDFEDFVIDEVTVEA